MSELLNALRRNLASMESIGDEDAAKILRKRIKAEEGEPEPDPEPEPHPAAFATDDDATDADDKPAAKPAASTKKGTR